MTRIAIILACLATPIVADTAKHGAQPYAGLETRQIKSLSADDIAEIKAGGGWGLALPAELNGLPGPRHVLDLRDELALTPEQVSQFQHLFDQMQAEAIEVGNRYIAAEAALSDAFAEPDLTPERLQSLLKEAASAREALRYVHLSRHLVSPSLLTDDQKRRYSVLRGYSDDPCATVPDGHSAALWRKHNGCTE